MAGSHRGKVLDGLNDPDPHDQHPVDNGLRHGGDQRLGVEVGLGVGGGGAWGG